MPGAVTSIQKAKVWLQECLDNHESTCHEPDVGFVPTRLIRLLPHNNAITCRLQDMSSFEVTTPYAALSYCWGGDQTFKTTTETLSQYLISIDPQVLPQTLQDAIHVAYHLGLEHIWIDALCIVQNSSADKAIEIGRMARVYQNATITISATRAKAVWDGFLAPRAPLGSHLPDRVFSLPCQRESEKVGNIILVPSTFEGLDPLDARGWTFQERVLSPRVLDFGTLRTQYTCQALKTIVPSDGWSQHPIDRAYGSGLDARIMAELMSGQIKSRQEIFSLWRKVVEGFTARALSFETDKLPAIAGMAEGFSKLVPDNQYCAGLWSSDLPRSLIWSVSSMNIDSRLAEDKIAAPSWSWAAVGCPVKFDNLFTGADAVYSTKIESCSTQPLDERASFGGVKGGELLLNAHYRRARWVRESIYGSTNVLLAVDDGIPEHPEAITLGFRAGNSTHISFRPDAIEREFERDVRYALDVFLVLLGTIPPLSSMSTVFPSFFGLVLREVETVGEKRYRRVGLFQKTLNAVNFRNYVDWFEREAMILFCVI